MLRVKALSAFKQLHKTRKRVFEGDPYALEFVRKKINEEFVKGKDIQSKEKIEGQIKLAVDAETELRLTVFQALPQDNGKFRLKIRPEMLIDSSKPYIDMPEQMIGPFKNKKSKCNKGK